MAKNSFKTNVKSSLKTKQQRKIIGKVCLSKPPRGRQPKGKNGVYVVNSLRSFTRNLGNGWLSTRVICEPVSNLHSVV